MSVVRFFVLMLALAYSSQAFALTAEQLEAFTKLPSPDTCRLMPFDEVKIRPGWASGTYIAIVTGRPPQSPIMDVKLIPIYYTKQPEYWGIEVVGCVIGINFVPNPPYALSMPVHKMGSKGVEIIGADRSEKFDIPPK